MKNRMKTSERKVITQWVIKPAITLVLTTFMLTSQAGKITSIPSATGAPGFGGWNLSNAEVIVNGTASEIGGTGSWYDEATGAYNFADDTDFTYQGNVDDGGGSTIMGLVLAKDFPVGEPSGIKVVNDDMAVKFPKPTNCIMATSYLADHFLDALDPQQVVCSSPFQSHKRYKLALLPPSVDGGTDGVDLVFNVEPELGARNYQVFQKINNWTDGRLQGFSVQLGFGVGDQFQSVEEAGVVLADLNISVPSDIWSDTQLANFSAGLFGPLDKHTGKIGFFDPETRAGFYINEYVVGVQPLTDTLTATITLGSDYVNVPAGAGAAAYQFGPWLPDSMLPYGVFFDDDGNPETDAELLAWYGYNPAEDALGWMAGSQDEDGPFSAIPDEELLSMGENLSYTMGEIDDLVNVGLNYLVTIGDVSTYPDSTFTIRVTPTVDTSGTPAPLFVDAEPEPLLLFSASDAAVLLDPNPEFVVGSLLTARVGDADLNVDPLVAEEVEVNIMTTTGLSDTLLLVEQGENRGVFAATLPEEYGHVAVGEEVTLSYTDADTGLGNAEVKTSTTTAITETLVILSDVSILELIVPEDVRDDQSRNIRITISNDNTALEAATGEIQLKATDGTEYTAQFTDLKVGGKMKFRYRWTSDLTDSSVSELVNWNAQVIVEGEVVDEANASTLVSAKIRGPKK